MNKKIGKGGRTNKHIKLEVVVSACRYNILSRGHVPTVLPK